MFTVYMEQIDALGVELEQSRRVALIVRLRQEFCDHLRAISTQELEKQVEDGCKAAAMLEINDTEHVYRFVRLRYLPASIWKRPAAQEMLVRVLTDTSVDAGRRLQFVETNIAVDRP